MRATGSPPHWTPEVGRPWAGIPDELRARGLRWTPQRRILVEVLSQTDGHVTGAELVDRCRALDPDTIPSTVYRTLDVLEQLGVLRHSHGADGREEFLIGDLPPEHRLGRMPEGGQDHGRRIDQSAVQIEENRAVAHR